jgi:hypothetical protein
VVKFYAYLREYQMGGQFLRAPYILDSLSRSYEKFTGQNSQEYACRVQVSRVSPTYAAAWIMHFQKIRLTLLIGCKKVDFLKSLTTHCSFLLLLL